jgi:hypothetical protein
MDRSRPLWLLSFPLALGGCLLGHALGYAFAGEPHRQAEMHGYLERAPLVAAALVCAIAGGLGFRAAGKLRGRPSPLPLVLLAPLAFAVQEMLERQLTGVPLHTLLEPAVALGLAAQLPIAIAAWLFARLLLRAADTVAARLPRRQRLRLSPQPRGFGGVSAIPLRAPAAALGYAGRAPPAL